MQFQVVLKEKKKIYIRFAYYLKETDKFTYREGNFPCVPSVHINNTELRARNTRAITQTVTVYHKEN